MSDRSDFGRGLAHAVVVQLHMVSGVDDAIVNGVGGIRDHVDVNDRSGKLGRDQGAAVAIAVPDDVNDDARTASPRGGALICAAAEIVLEWVRE